MKLLFVYDMRVWENGSYYYTTSFTQEIIDRYRSLYQSIAWCTCVVPNPDTAFCQKFNPIRRDSVEMISLHKISSAGDLIKYRRENSRILEQAIQNSERVIIRLPSLIGGEAAALAEKYGKPYMVELVSCTWDALWNHSLRGKLLAPWSWVRTRQEVKRAPMVLYVTNQFLQRRYPTAGLSVGCSDVSLPGVDEAVLCRRLERIGGRAPGGAPLRLGTIAAVNVRYKGQADVIKALAALKKQGIRMEYELAGSGDPSRLRTLAQRLGVEDQVHLLGSVPHDKIFAWLETIDLYLQPSKQEGLPRAVVEAMSCACPVAGARTGGIPELVDEEWIFRPGDVKDICRILQKAAAEDLSRQAQRSFQVATRYEKDRLEQLRGEFFQKFVQQKGGGST